MKQQFIFVLSVSSAFSAAAWGQNNQRQANLVGGGSPDHGKCTIEVRVDGAAEVEIRGSSAVLRTLSGQPAQWRRFECTGAMPAKPRNFRFAGVDGRGRQTLVRDPQSGGVAVVRIEDKDNGSEGYTFDLFWGTGDGPRSNNNQGGNYNNQGGNYNNQAGNYQTGRPPTADNRNRDILNQIDRNQDRYQEYGEDRYRPGYREGEYYRRYGHGFAIDEAVRICQESVAEQARRRFRNSDLHFGPTRMEDNPGREDWLIGRIDVHRQGREERFGFACSVDFGSGRVRSAQINDRPLGPITPLGR